MKYLIQAACLALFACTAPEPTHQTVAAEFAYRLEAVVATTDLEQEIAHAAGRIAAVASSWEADPTPTQEMADGMRSMATYLEATADLVESGIEPPPVASLPFDAPPIPEYSVPTLADCEWTVEGGVYTSMVGLPSVSNVRDAYRASRAAGHVGPVTFGVWDKIGRAVVGGLWGGNDEHSITERVGGEWATDLSVEFVGLDNECEVMLGWSTKFGFPARVAAFNIGLRGPNNSFIILANDGAGTVILDGCWWLQCDEFTGNQKHASGLHLDKWDTLIWRNHQFKGTLLREHSAYLKSCTGTGTWIVGNDLRGGNRSGFQVRPQRLADQYGPASPEPQGPLVVADNFAHGYGWEHASADGGAAITVWSSPTAPVYIYGNKITDARYGCLVLSTQSQDRNFLNANGFPIHSLYLHGNTFENKRATRSSVSISSVEEVYLYSSEVDGGHFTLDDPWAMRVGGIANGSVTIHDVGYARYMSNLGVWTYDPADATKTIRMPDSQIAGYLVSDAPPVVEPPITEPWAWLDGQPLPARPPVDIHKPRPDRYGLVMNGGTVDFDSRHFSGVSSAGILMKRDCTMSNFTVYASGGDGMKFDGGAAPGTISVTGAHVFGLGLAEDAHADGFQGRGNLAGATFTDCFFDQPTNAGDGTRSNACVLTASVQGPIGTTTFEGCIFRGGNYSIMVSEKGSGNDPGWMHHEGSAFIVELDSPRYGLFGGDTGSSRQTFGEGNAVYYLNPETGLCEFLTEDVTGFDFKAWHQAEFGRETAR